MAREDEMIRKQQALLRNDFQEEKPEPKAKLELDYVEKRKPFKLRVKPVDNFIMDLYHLAKNCNYGTLHDELV